MLTDECRVSNIDSRRRAWLEVLASCVLVSAGCMVGPGYHRPKTAADPNEHYQWLPSGWAEAHSPDGPSRWWEVFNDPVTNDLVSQALTHNTDLKAAAAGVQRSQALLEQAHGIRLPDVGYAAGRDQSQMSFVLPNISTPMGSFGGRLTSRSTTYSQQLSISYIVDLFGRLKRAERAAARDLLATQADAEALAHAIVAQVVQTRVQIATQQQLLHIADATIASWERSLEVTEQRYQGGLVSPLDVKLIRQNLEGAKAQRIALSQTLALTNNALAVLCGGRPGRSQALAENLPATPALAPIPIGLPATLLDRRPDVQAAELRLAAATERVGVSIAQMYPDLTLTGSAGMMSDRFQDISSSDFGVYNAAVGLAAPIFKGGQLRAGVRAARASAEEAAQVYAGVVLKAFREVEDALVKHQMLTAEIEQIERRLQLAQESEQMAQERYKRGAEPILVVLETQRVLRMTENDLAVAQGQLWQARIELHLALGGDWGIREREARSQKPEARIRTSEDKNKKGSQSNG
jgi:NodT family efflux transporter outer membrane factor (OMF) lipoprotein